MPASGVIELADAKSGSPSRALWTGAFLAALAIESHARLVTFDQGCRRFAALFSSC